MSYRRIIAISLLSGVVGVALLLGLYRSRTMSAARVGATSTPAGPARVKPADSNDVEVNANEVYEIHGKRTIPRNSREADYLRDAQRDGNMPISFYGKVVDENGASVEGANVEFGWTNLATRGVSSSKTLSDAVGEFMLEGVRGKSLSIRVTKEGYLTPSNDPRRFDYADVGQEFYVPDRVRPVIFSLQREGLAEKLVHRSASYVLAYNPGVYYYNLESGIVTKKVPDGAKAVLKVAVTREPSQGEAFNWTCRLEALEGGLQETSEVFPFRAPKDGYKLAWEASRMGGPPSFENGLSTKLYMMTRGQYYARLEISIRNSDDSSAPAGFSVQSYLNPSGSVNLEYDGGKKRGAKNNRQQTP